MCNGRIMYEQNIYRCYVRTADSQRYNWALLVDLFLVCVPCAPPLHVPRYAVYLFTLCNM